MTCSNCGSPELVPKDIPQPSETGRFKEVWECGNCDAQGYVSGDEAEPPENWERYGAAFDGDNEVAL